MHLAAKWIIVVLVSCAFVCARAGASWEGSLSCKTALTKGKVTTDVAFALIGSWEPFTVLTGNSFGSVSGSDRKNA
jgi:hypothetical protein